MWFTMVRYACKVEKEEIKKEREKSKDGAVLPWPQEWSDEWLFDEFFAKGIEILHPGKKVRSTASYGETTT
jgi:hypothetical protein